ncbi:MAG: antitoxin family protein [Candidatus Korarchaeota archaeon]|nr:antitoxin family protein [Candidatus Korarchaeota archaeon]
MSGEIVIEAVYEGGVFRPLRKVDLPEGKRVRVLIRTERSPKGLLRALTKWRDKISFSREEIERFLEERR